MKSDNSFKELLNHAAWPVGVSVSMNFIRESSVSFPTMNTVLLRFVNTLSSISPSLTLVPKVFLFSAIILWTIKSAI